MICKPCAMAGDGVAQDLHNCCEYPVSCSCQHRDLSDFGTPERADKIKVEKCGHEWADPTECPDDCGDDRCFLLCVLCGYQDIACDE